MQQMRIYHLTNSLQDFYDKPYDEVILHNPQDT